jgi:hypothetical protein
LLDPLGPLFFSLALARLLQNVEMDGLELNAWYLDDGTVRRQDPEILNFTHPLTRFRIPIPNAFALA